MQIYYQPSTMEQLARERRIARRWKYVALALIPVALGGWAAAAYILAMIAQAATR